MKLIVIIICLLFALTEAEDIQAKIPHEEPDTAPLVFSGVAVFQYCANSLDLVLMKNLDEVKTRHEQMSFVNVPVKLNKAINEFSVSTTKIAYLITDIDKNLTLQRTLVIESRFTEAREIGLEISENISFALRELVIIEKAIENLGEGFSLSSGPKNNTMHKFYDEVQQKIGQLYDLLDAYKKSLEETKRAIDDLMQSSLLTNTTLTLSITPHTAFIGDNVTVEGLLTAAGQALMNREVDILLGGTTYLTLITDDTGQYREKITIPYDYVREQQIQALYYPRNDDIKRYLSSLSQPVKIATLFYETSLVIDIPEETSPGLLFNVRGRFISDKAPVPDSRIVEVYLDSVFSSQFNTNDEFSLDILFDNATSMGKHIITIAVPPAGRYSSFMVDGIIDVTRFDIFLDMELPNILIGPAMIFKSSNFTIGGFETAVGGVSVEGQLYSNTGPLINTAVDITSGNSLTKIITGPDGTFTVTLKPAMGFILFGSQDITINVSPQESWYAPISITKSIKIINVISCSAILIIVVLLGIFLSRYLKRMIATNQRETSSPRRPVSPAIPPLYILEKDITGKGGTTRGRLLKLYIRIIKLIQKISNTMIKPHQTIREFAHQRSISLGPAAKYFTQLTVLVEKLLYSSYEPSDDDSQIGQKLSKNIEKELKGEGI